MKCRTVPIIFSTLVLAAASGSGLAADNTVLNQVTRWYDSSNSDHMLSTNSSESGATNEGQIFYIPSTNISGTTAIYRLYKSSIPDHMMSGSTTEGGYTNEGTLGYKYNSSGAGMYPIKRLYNSSLSDHMVPFNGESPAGYTTEFTAGYGYGRYGTQCEVNTSVTAGGVTIKANEVAGGIISELTWNGKQFINNWDYGRQIQTAFNLDVVHLKNNPTEGGSKYGCPGVKDAEFAQGSPTIDLDVLGSSLTTETRPLIWVPENQGGDDTHPVLWDGTIEKEVKLNHFTTYDAHVMKWTTTLDMPQSYTYFDWELVTAYLNGEFNKLYTYDADTDTRKDKTSVVTNNTCRDPSADADLRPSAGGVIIANSTGTHALGAYRSDDPNDSFTNTFALCKFLNGGGNGKYDANTTKWTVLGRRTSAGVSSGTISGVAYLVVGTLDDVTTTMYDMNVDGI